jgi:hypothetical protein
MRQARYACARPQAASLQQLDSFACCPDRFGALVRGTCLHTPPLPFSCKLLMLLLLLLLQLLPQLKNAQIMSCCPARWLKEDACLGHRRRTG